ncbi:MAG: hypothetical protein ACLP70_25290 [Streptosporangiaceae bacterium]
MSTNSELARDVTEHSFSRAWTTILAERQDAPNGGSVSVLPDFHLSLRVMPSVDVARGSSSEGSL